MYTYMAWYKTLPETLSYWNGKNIWASKIHYSSKNLRLSGDKYISTGTFMLLNDLTMDTRFFPKSTHRITVINKTTACKNNHEIWLQVNHTTVTVILQTLALSRQLVEPSPLPAHTALGGKTWHQTTSIHYPTEFHHQLPTHLSITRPDQYTHSLLWYTTCTLVIMYILPTVLTHNTVVTLMVNALVLWRVNRT